MATRTVCDYYNEADESLEDGICRNYISPETVMWYRERGEDSGWLLATTEDEVGDFCPLHHPKGYIIIQRQHSADLSIEYPTMKAAVAALESLFIDGLCEEDALDCYASDEPLEDAEHIIAPEPGEGE